MPSAWVEHIKEFAKRKGLTYGCALSDPECSKEYQAKKPPKTSKSAGGAKSAGGENISMEISEKKARGRPKKYATDEERKKAKSAKTIESNKRKKFEKLSAGAEKLEMAVPDMSVKPKGIVIKPRPAPVEKDITTYPKMIDAFTLKLEKEVKKFEKIKSFKSEKAYEDAKLFYKNIVKEHTDITQGKEKDDYFKAKYGANSLETGWAKNGEDKDAYWDNGKIREKQSKLFHDLYIAIADKDKRSAGKGMKGCGGKSAGGAKRDRSPSPSSSSDKEEEFKRRRMEAMKAEKGLVALLKKSEISGKPSRKEIVDKYLKPTEQFFKLLSILRRGREDDGSPRQTDIMDYQNMIETIPNFRNVFWNYLTFAIPEDEAFEIYNQYKDYEDAIEEGMGAGIRQELSKARKASEALAQSAQSMKGGMFPRDFLSGVSAGGERRDTTPPPTRPLTQAQGDAILRAINLPKRRRGRELERVLDDIEGGGDEQRMIRRFEGFVSGFNQPPMVRRIMLKFRRAYAESIAGATDSEGSSGEGAGLVPSSEETKKQILDSVAYYTEPRMKIFNEAVKKQSKALGGKGVLKDAIAKHAEAKEKGLELLPEPIKRKIKQARATEKLLADNKAKILAEDMKTGSYGGGLLATHSAEDAGGLTHIYPLSHAHILEMCKHLI